MTFLLHLFVWGGGERAASRSTNQRTRLLRRTSAGSAGERALPRDTVQPSPVRFSPIFLTSSFLICFQLFLPLLAVLCLLCYSSHLLSFSLHPSLSPSYPEAGEYKLSLGLPTALLLGLWPHDHHSKFTCRTLSSRTTIPQLCCVGRNLF